MLTSFKLFSYFLWEFSYQLDKTKVYLGINDDNPLKKSKNG